MKHRMRRANIHSVAVAIRAIARGMPPGPAQRNRPARQTSSANEHRGSDQREPANCSKQFMIRRDWHFAIRCASDAVGIGRTLFSTRHRTQIGPERQKLLRNRKSRSNLTESLCKHAGKRNCKRTFNLHAGHELACGFARSPILIKLSPNPVCRLALLHYHVGPIFTHP